MTKTPSLDATDKVGAEGATAPRITLDYMKSQIEKVYYKSASTGLETKGVCPSLDCMTMCYLVLKSGFVLVGKSTPMSPENFDPEKGRTFAYEDALRSAWPLFAFHQLQAKVD